MMPPEKIDYEKLFGLHVRNKVSYGTYQTDLIRGSMIVHTIITRRIIEEGIDYIQFAKMMEPYARRVYNYLITGPNLAAQIPQKVFIRMMNLLGFDITIEVIDNGYNGSLPKTDVDKTKTGNERSILKYFKDEQANFEGFSPADSEEVNELGGRTCRIAMRSIRRIRYRCGLQKGIKRGSRSKS